MPTQVTVPATGPTHSTESRSRLSVLLAHSGMRVMCFPSRCTVKPTVLRLCLLLLVFSQTAVSTLGFRALNLGERHFGWGPELLSLVF